MTRQQVLKQLEDTFGFLPSFIRSIPDGSLELEWQLMKSLRQGDGGGPNKYQALLGIGIAAARRCPYTLCLHAELARLDGATELEIEDAMQLSGATTGLSTYLYGLQCDLREFRPELRRMATVVRAEAH